MIKTLFFFVVVALLALMSRWLPHPPNFTAVSGFFFVCGVLASRQKWFAYAAFLPLVISDLALGGYPGILFVYAAHLGVLLFGWLLAKGPRKVLPFAVYSFSAAFVFFVISNFGVWWSGGIYPRTSAGLVECFVMALPFFHQTVLAQLVFGAIFVYGFYWFEARTAATVSTSQPRRRT
jgi:hypothetical protein